MFQKDKHTTRYKEKQRQQNMNVKKEEGDRTKKIRKTIKTTGKIKLTDQNLLK